MERVALKDLQRILDVHMVRIVLAFKKWKDNKALMEHDSAELVMLENGEEEAA